MASLPAYIISSLLIVALGLRHFACSCLSFLRSPRDFSARTWHPFSCLPRLLQHLPLYLELLAFSLGIAYDAHAVSLSGDGTSAHKIAGFQHLAMLAMFFVVVIVILVSESTQALPLPSEVPFLLAAIAFASEWMVIGGQGFPSSALEGECFKLMARLAVVCAISCLLLAWRPVSFLANTVLCAGIILQGTWIMQIGLSLLADAFMPEGCHRMLDLINGFTQCDLEETKLRAIALMELAFICHIIAVVIVCVFLFALTARRLGCRRNPNYDMLDLDGDSDGAQMKALSSKIDVD